MGVLGLAISRRVRGAFRVLVMASLLLSAGCVRVPGGLENGPPTSEDKATAVRVIRSQLASEPGTSTTLVGVDVVYGRDPDASSALNDAWSYQYAATLRLDGVAAPVVVIYPRTVDSGRLGSTSLPDILDPYATPALIAYSRVRSDAVVDVLRETLDPLPGTAHEPSMWHITLYDPREGGLYFMGDEVRILESPGGVFQQMPAE